MVVVCGVVGDGVGLNVLVFGVGICEFVFLRRREFWWWEFLRERSAFEWFGKKLLLGIRKESWFRESR